MLGVITPEQAEAKITVQSYLKIPTKIRKPTLEAFIEPKEMTFENLLNTFIDKVRLKRAQRMKGEELTIQEEKDNQITALIREYHIVIDLVNRLIPHDCADRGRVLSNRKFCKARWQAIAIPKKSVKHPRTKMGIQTIHRITTHETLQTQNWEFAGDINKFSFRKEWPR